MKTSRRKNIDEEQHEEQSKSIVHVLSGRSSGLAAAQQSTKVFSSPLRA